MNKINKTLLISTLLLLLLLPIVAATYNYPGTDTKTLEGVWGLTAPTETGSVGLTNNMSYHTPLMGDLNNDGTNELVLIDGNNVEIYHDKTLTGITGLNGQDNVEHAILYDITGDNNTEIITVGGDQVTIFTYNSSDELTLLINHSFTGQGVAGTDLMIGCKATNDCIVVIASQTQSFNNVLQVARFNITGLYNNSGIETATNSGNWYLPLIRNIQVSNNHFVFSAFASSSSLRIFYIDTGVATGITIDHKVDISAPDIFLDTDRNDFTSPLIANFESTTSGDEVVIGYQNSFAASQATEFKMSMYSEAGVHLHDYPSSITETEGNLVSNIIRANAFGTGTDYFDFCVIGYDLDDDTMNMLCGSERSNTVFDSREMSVASGYDLSEVQYANVIIHAVDTSSTTTDGVDLNEVLTPFGLFNLVPGGGIIDGSLQQVWGTSSYDNPVMIPVDLEGNGKFDVIRREIDTAYYLDDGFTNEQIDITKLGFSLSPICQNRTYTLTVTTLEAEQETGVCWLEILYENETVFLNQTNKTKTHAMTNVKFYQSFNTTGIMFLDAYCTDLVNTPPTSERRQIEILQETGLETTSTCYEPGEAEEEESFVTTPEQTEEETFDDEADELFDTFGLTSKTSRNLIALIICTVLAVILFLKTNEVLFGAAGFMVGSIGCFFLGLMSLFPLMLMIIISVLIIVLNLKNLGSGG